MRAQNRHDTIKWNKRRKNHEGDKCRNAKCGICSPHKDLGNNKEAIKPKYRYMKKLFFFLLLIPVLSFGQMARTDSVYNGIKFIEYYPTHTKPQGIICYLHGLGEIGNDLNLVTKNEIPRLIEAGAQYPYIIICPQIPSGKGTSWSANILKTVIKIIAGYNITPRHATGLSLGATGTWDIVRFAPQGFFETACIVTGRTSTYDSAKWHSVKWRIYHGTQDLTYKISFDRKCYQYLLKIGADATMKEYAAGHQIWPMAYRDSEYWEFLRTYKGITFGTLTYPSGITLTPAK